MTTVRGVRGDLKAVVRAILLDPEARGPVKMDADYGHLREPALFVVARCARAERNAPTACSCARSPRRWINPCSRRRPYSTSIRPTTSCPRTALLGPEFALQNTTTAFARINFVNTLVVRRRSIRDPTVYGATGTQLDWTPCRQLPAIRTRWSTRWIES